MPYTDVISLAQARTYLRIDDTQSDTDAEITQMINSALSYIEKRTNHIMFPRDQVYYIDESIGQNYQSYQAYGSYTTAKYVARCKYVYDFPINSITEPVDTSDIETKTKQLYTIYNVFDSELESITLNVGYADPADIPPALIDAALYKIKLTYYETEMETSSKAGILKIIDEYVMANKRFVM